MIRPNREIASLVGRNPLALFDSERARPVDALAYEQGVRWGERLGQTTAA